MAQRAGTADLPLHGGRVPAWLADRMARLGAVIAEAIVLEYGRDDFLRRLAHPFWFQSFGAVMGMDWHSSGVTTSVLGALSRGLAPLRSRTRPSRLRRPRPAFAADPGSQLLAVGERTGLDGEALGRASRLVAKVDSAAVQDGFDLYLHGFIVADDGKWVVVQQGMNGDSRYARRYHWLSEGLTSFVEAPHAAIEGAGQGHIVNLTDRRAASAREAQTRRFCATRGPTGSSAEVAALDGRTPPPPARAASAAPRHAGAPRRPAPGRDDPSAARRARCRGRPRPDRFRRVAARAGRRRRTVQALAMVAEVVHGAPCRFADPARFSLAHGGKDRAPFRGADRGLRPHHHHPEIGDRSLPSRRRRAPRRDPPPRRPGAAARIHARPGLTSPPTSPTSATTPMPSAGAASSAGNRSRPGRAEESRRIQIYLEFRHIVN